MFQPGLELGRARQKAFLREVEIHQALKPLDKEEGLSMRDSVMLSLSNILIQTGEALRRRVQSCEYPSIPQLSK